MGPANLDNAGDGPESSQLYAIGCARNALDFAALAQAGLATLEPSSRPGGRTAVLTEWVKDGTLAAATCTEAAAGLVIVVAVAESAFRTAALVVRRPAGSDPDASHEAKEEIRLRLGRWLALALEFELGADILRTAIAPTWSEIGQLAAIAAVRTALNYFLQQEIDKAAARRSSAAPGRSAMDLASTP